MSKHYRAVVIRTLKGAGTSVADNSPRSVGISPGLSGSNCNCCNRLTENKNNSILAKFSPAQILGPVELIIYN